MAKHFNPAKLRFATLPFYEIIESVVEPRELVGAVQLPALPNDQTRRVRYQLVTGFRLKMEQLCMIGLAANWDNSVNLPSSDRLPIQLLVR